jgi:ribonuclease III
VARDPSQLEEILGYAFADKHLLRYALTHSSFGGNHNERLEFLGDAVIDLVMSEELFRLYPNATEGELTRMRAGLVSRQAMAVVAAEYQLGEFLLLGAGELKTGGERRESNLANALEAVIGAIYLDGGYDSCRPRVLAWYRERMSRLRPQRRDPKSRLQEYLQGRGKPRPSYDVVSVQGPDQDQVFTVSCTVVELAHPVLGVDRNRRRAEQAAARAALDELGVGDE